jgi:PAS domain S-box-containing protein
MVVPGRRTGIPPIGDAPWGTHLCHFFESRQDLLDAVMPFLATGLAARELCVWIVAEPTTAEEAWRALAAAIPDIDRLRDERCIEVAMASDWAGEAGRDRAPRTGIWESKLAEARSRGLVGVRLAGLPGRFPGRVPASFCEKLRRTIAGQPILALCTFPPGIGAGEVLAIAGRHDAAVWKRNGEWMRTARPDGSSHGFAELPRGPQRAASDQTLDRVTDGFVSIDRDWRYTYVNRNAARILRKSADELVGSVLWDVFPEAVGNAVHVAQEQAMATQQPVFLEIYHPPWERWFENRIYPSESGHSIFFTDITDRKRADAERDRLLASETAARGDAETALRRLNAIHSITDSALVQLGLDQLLAELLSRLRQALRADRSAFSLVDDDRMLVTRAADGVDMSVMGEVRVPFGEGLTGRIAAENRPLVADPFSIDPTGIQGLPRPELMPWRAAAGAPLRIGGKVMGVVTVAFDRPHQFTDEELKLLLIVADRVAPAIERAQLVEAAKTAHDRLGALSRRLLSAQEEERRRLARELHDELGQVLTAVKINLESLERRPGALPLSSALREAIGSVDDAMQTVRDLALDLRPSVLDDLGLPAALRSHADRLARDARLEAHLSIDAVPHLEPDLEIACFRVAQEALTNIARHAGASHVWLDLHLVAEGLELRVRDDGTGFDVPTARERAVGGTSMGLLGMEERVSLVGGEFEVVAEPGSGTYVRARFPVGAPPAAAPDARATTPG